MSCAEFTCGEDASESPAQRCEIGDLDRIRFHHGAAKRERTSRARVMRESARKAQVDGCSNSRVDAHVGHHACDDEFLDIGGVQIVQECRLTKGAGVVLDDHRFPMQRRDDLVNLGTARCRQEECRARPRRQMLNVKDWQASISKGRDERCSVSGCQLGADELHRAPWKVVVLNVDDEERC